MAKAKEPARRTRVEQRLAARGLVRITAGVSRQNLAAQVLAGVTLLAIAIPEQLATSQLAMVPAFLALIAFIAATLVFVVFGSNPIISVGADSTIAPLFAVALLRLALPDSPQYLELVAATAVVTGILVTAVGLLRLGWLADFLSLPIVAGFMTGIGIIIAVHQLPRVFGVKAGGESVISRLDSLSHHLSHVSAWSIGIAVATLAVMVLGERFNPRLPMALAAVIGSTILVSALSLSSHGVAVLGTVVVTAPTWRLHWFSAHEWAVIVTTALTLVVVIISQSAATARSSADDFGVADNLDNDFLGVGLANIVVGLCGSFPVNASPARTTVSGLAGGRTKVVGLVAALGALVLTPLVHFAQYIPLPALAGVLLFIAGRLIKVSQLGAILRASAAEFIVALVTCLGVILLGVEIGLAFAVGMAILIRTWRTSRPRMIELGRRHGTTSWEPLDAHGVARVEHVVVIFFDETLYFANADVFRRQLHDLLMAHPATTHVILDAVAMSDVDYTGLVTLTRVAKDLAHDSISVSVARAIERVKREVTSFSDDLRGVAFFDSVDAAVNDATGAKR